MRSAILFLLAILTPCAVLGWVSWRSMKGEAGVIRGQRTALYQQSADNAARAAAGFMNAQLQAFRESVDSMLASGSPDDLRPRFYQSLRNAWPAAAAGFVMDAESGRILPQVEPSEQKVTAFLARHAWFFAEEPQPLFLELPVSDTPALKKKIKSEAASVPGNRSITDALESLAGTAAGPQEPLPAKSSVPRPPVAARTDSTPASNAPAPAAAPPLSDSIPMDRKAPPSAHEEIAAPGTAKPVTTTLSHLISRYDTGIASQVHEGELFVFVWHRPADLPHYTFAAALLPEAINHALTSWPAFSAPDNDTCLAITDHLNRPAAQWTNGAPCEPESWSAPLVFSGIGGTLPNWKASIFLRDPAVFTNAASGSRWQLGIIVTTASLAAVAGAFFILRDARRAARDARLKTDFVSNVSHELKTPLTSIRMFSDLLGSNPSAPPEKTKRYAEVIASEAARLTRLINNVLNFSRMEDGTQKLKSAPLDLRSLTMDTVEQMRPQLEKDGFTIHLTLPEDPLAIPGDSDALSQVLLNLLSNAAKYGIHPDGPREAGVSLASSGHAAVLTVTDRGPGVPRGEEHRIFEKFHRAHDSLSSGTAGSGLGLTIARRLVEAHRGTLVYSHRDGGGAVFTATLPKQ